MKNVLFIITLLTGCSDVGRVTGFTDGTCMGAMSSIYPNSNVTITKERDGTRVRCIVEFDITKEKK